MLFCDARLTSFLAASVFLTACLAGDPTPVGASQALDSPDRPIEWSPTELYSVGGIEAPEWAEFGEIAGIGFDGTGNLFVLDFQTRVITQISPAGEFVRTLGGAGQGPGELRRPIAMTVWPDGTIAVADAGHRAFVMFDVEGTWIENARVDMAAEGLPVGQLHPLPDGGVLGIPGIHMSSGSGSANPNGGSGSSAQPEGRPIHRFTLESDVPGSDAFMAWSPPPPPDGPESDISGTNAEGGFVRVQMTPIEAFTPGLSFSVLPDGRLVVADSSTYNLKLVDLGTGTIHSVLERPIQPTKVNQRLRDLERDRRLAVAREGLGLIRVGAEVDRTFDQEAILRMQEDQIANMSFHSEIPVIENVAVDSEGRIWVQRSSGVPGEPGPTDLITPDGRYLGSFDPVGPRIPDLMGPSGLIAVIEKDEFDVATIRVMRLQGM